MAKNEQQGGQDVLAALRTASTGLVYTSDSTYPLEPFCWPNGGKLTTKRLLELAGAEAGTAVAVETLDDFLHAVPPEDKDRFDKLAQVLRQQLTGIKVYKVGDEAEKQAYVCGKTRDGQWVGLKTTVVET